MNKKFIYLGIIFLVIVLSIPILRNNFNQYFIHSDKVIEGVIPDSSRAKCPYYVDNNFPNEYFSNIFNEVMVSYSPSLITSSNEIVPLKEKFDPYTEPFGGEFYTIPSGAYPWTETKFDVDNDQKDERILFADTAMNHTPNLAVIVKDGYIIFKAEGANIVIKESSDNNGFFLDETVDWNSGEYKTTKYIFRDGKFIPVWFQTSCAVRPQSD